MNISLSLILIIVLSILAGILHFMYLNLKNKYEALKIHHEELETACEYLIKCWTEASSELENIDFFGKN